MYTLISIIDRLTAATGKLFAWTILLLTFGVGYEVFVRYVMREPTSWAFDVSYMMYGVLFMMAGAYTLARDGHVRGDVIYRLWPPRVQATIEMTLYFLFFFPGILALVISGADYAAESWSYNGGLGEVSVMSPANVPVYQFKTIIPIAGSLLLLQGVAQVLRCVICLRTGAWPSRLTDVEETETALKHLQDYGDQVAPAEKDAK